MRRRILWLLWILLGGALYLFENHAGTLTVLLSAVLLPIFGALPLLCPGVNAQLRMDSALKKGQTADGTLTLENVSPLPLPRVSAAVICRNLRTGEVFQAAVEVSLLPKQNKSLDFQILSPHCGQIVAELDGAVIWDLFGLFSKKLPLSAACGAPVLPELFVPDLSLASAGASRMAEDAPPWEAPGSDPEEPVAIRDYIPGDPIRRIHWKLSEKADRTMVREFAQPTASEVALLLESAEALDPSLSDAVTEVFASISSALTSSGIAHRIFWQGSPGIAPDNLPIRSPEDISRMISLLLSLPAQGDASVTAGFTQAYDRCPYAHVVIVSAGVPRGADALASRCRVSLLLPRQMGVPEGMQPDGAHVLTFPARDPAAALSRLEV